MLCCQLQSPCLLANFGIVDMAERRAMRYHQMETILRERNDAMTPEGYANGINLVAVSQACTYCAQPKHERFVGKTQCTLAFECCVDFLPAIVYYPILLRISLLVLVLVLWLFTSASNLSTSSCRAEWHHPTASTCASSRSLHRNIDADRDHATRPATSQSTSRERASTPRASPT